MAFNPETAPDDLLEKARAIELVVFDVDGVMTDGRLHYTADGKEIKAFHAQDGLGIKHLMRSGMQVAIITGRNSPIVNNRMNELGITHVFQGRGDKLTTWRALLDELSVEPQHCAYVGDDINDVPVLKHCGLAISVPNGRHAAQNLAHWITPTAGGYGAARDVCDLLLHARGKLTDLIENYHAP